MKVYLVPKIVDLHGAKRHSVPAEAVDSIHGTVTWGPEFLIDGQDDYVTDKDGVRHYPERLYTEAELRAQLTAEQAKSEKLEGHVAMLVGALNHVDSYLDDVPHGDNCFVSNHYEGDPGNNCNCGKDAVCHSVDNALTATQSDVEAYLAESGAKMLEPICEVLHYPECWDTSAYPDLLSAITEISHCTVCTEPERHGYPSNWAAERKKKG